MINKNYIYISFKCKLSIYTFETIGCPDRIDPYLFVNFVKIWKSFEDDEATVSNP